MWNCFKDIINSKKIDENLEFLSKKLKKKLNK